jgi:acetyltransferase-like isoleucine patch superfamily enzyme
MLGKIIKFLYFNIGFKLRYIFWKIVITSNGGKIGKGVKIYEGVRIVPGEKGTISIGNNVSILRNATISTTKEGKISIGNDVHIGEGTIITSHSEIIIRDFVIIGPHNIIADADHVFSEINRPIITQGYNAQRIEIEEDVWIASSCCILKGVVVGKGSVIGASSVVNKSIPSFSVAVGVPTEVIKKRGMGESSI